MDHKPWLWRKKAADKTNAAAEGDKVNVSVKGNEEEVEAHQAEKAELENNLKALSDKLASALSECNSKDALVKKHAKMAQDAVQGWEKVEANAGFLKHELDKSFQVRAAGEERIAQLDEALKDCMQQLRFVREEQEQRVHEAMMKASREFEKSKMALEEKLAETTRRLSKIGAENTHLSNALLVKDKLIEDLRKQLTQVEADFNALTLRLESTEKDNASLKYEVRVLEKELEIRNEEREFNRRTADVSHKQNLEGAKKIAKLESECQRLRLLVRKRLPGPAALAKMKNEVEMLGRDSVDMRRRKLNDSTVDNFPETPSKKVNILTEQLYAMEEENQTLKEALNKKIKELQFSRNMYARVASKLSQSETPLEESLKGHATMESMRSNLLLQEVSVASASDIGSDDKVSCADSWASALITELEHFRTEKQKGSLTNKTVGTSDINLMDDFVEMEKLAVVSADKQSAPVSSVHAFAPPLESEYSSELVGSNMVPISDGESGFSLSNRETRFNNIVNGKAPHWVEDIVKLVMEHNRVAGRNPEQILEDLRIALARTEEPKPGEFVNARTNRSHLDALNPSSVKSCTSWKGSDKSLVNDSPRGVSDVDISNPQKSNPQFQPDLSKSLCKVIELIEGIHVPSPDNNPENGSRKDGNVLTYKNSENAGYMVRVFQWKASELGDLLQQFVHACYDLLNGRAGLEKFAKELTAALDWILNHCFSLQDVSSMKDAIKKEFDWDDTRSETEGEAGAVGHFSNGHIIQIEELQANLVKENRKLNNELVNLESERRELEGRLQSASDKSEYLMNQLKESEKAIASLRTELQCLRESKEIVEDHFTNHKMMNEDLETQLTEARVELNEALQKFSSLEVQLQNKYNRCAELEATCLELQLQLDSVKKSPNSNLNQGERKAQNDWEITAASEKLAECQETILNLGKQLKAMASPREAALFDKVITHPSDTDTPTAKAASQTPHRNLNQRSSLLDKMLAEDGASINDFTSPMTKEVGSNSTSTLGPNILVLNSKYQNDNAAADSLAIAPSKKRGGGSLWRKLVWRKKKGNNLKTPLPIAP
ncbi:filament-like plant protein 7 [Pyrus x bretschneideri]|uniref:filament-like plant protein 7 n=1 Tax=Pyrus x bretschneideri TaxID=225117 RepID=UPI002030027F|nr:filament-like plant protein 7 [Pyrus x bretschneideri]XP_018505336.2 filament-like plant protein 7 [Pyrus x bretschneideri]XP_048431457.1 filament-like plant protein 7 [Pyrus x bretschneideri]